jgi:hypothetical protein
MADNQILIKILLISVFAVFAVILLLPGSGVRRLAVRRLTLLVLFAAAIAAVAFPQAINAAANLLGVGRGTDLILYALVIVFIGNSISASIRHRHLEREVTQLAREMALQAADPPQAPRATAARDQA